jgi:eukaryotic-like serine/threonine-protein kinase
MTPRASAPPRQLGILQRTSRPARPRPGDFPYAIGTRIAGDMVVIGHLAVGRVGYLYQVWSAREWCAFTCKILSPERRGSRAAVAALRREARILRSIRHPNIVRGFGEGTHDGLHFLLMEYLEGASLLETLEAQRRRRLAPADAVRSAIHLGASLYHLHRLGWLHLDLKPANLLLRGGVPILIDLDTARRIGDARPVSRLGTGPYMAPEQIAREPLGAAADIYGLGALLYELVTGRWPFESAYEESDEHGLARRQYPQSEGVPPTPPRHFEPALAESLDRTIMTCLAPAPADRFDSMHTLLLALASELEEPVSLWPAGVQAERRREPRS